ncbi:MAG TPA: hypothetical protein VK902_03545 [Rubrobacter sp.]|jgi:hypothetical protein|nr:hypothetical protein [Rubrobacter sp.]
MKPPSVNKLSVLLAAAVLLCHGVFGALHLVCDPLEWCAGGAQHSAEHQPRSGAVDAHEHPTGHDVSSPYFAVVALGLLGLILKLLPKCAAGLRIWLGTRWPAVLRRVPAVLRPPPIPTLPVLQVFRL